MRFIYINILVSFFSLLSITQGATLNVLELNLTEAKNDTEKTIALNQLGSYFEGVSNYPKSFDYLFQALQLNTNNPTQLIYTYNYLGYNYWHKSNYDSSLYYHQKALEIANTNNINDENLAFTYLMLGNDYYDKGAFNKASSYYFKSLKLAEQLKNNNIRVQCHNRLSKLYFKLNDFQLTVEHVNKAIRLNTANNTREFGVSYNSLGNLTLNSNNLDSALFYFNLTLLQFQNCGDVIGQSIASINLGDTYLGLFNKNESKNNLDSSYYYYQLSYQLNKKVDNQFGMVYGLWGMADVNVVNQNYSSALSNYYQALAVSLEIGAKSEELNLYKKLHELFDIKNIKDSSLYYLKKHINLKNLVESTEQSKQLLKQESKYEAEKLIAQEKAESDKQKLIESEKNKWKNIIISMIIMVALILLFISYISLKRLKIIRSKNEIINKINQELNSQHQEIMDSITYAKRIQRAILPTKELVNELLNDSFILYLPKDIVAGDFYWLEHKKGKVIFAVADCTGHGVPGAMVSVICNNALNRSVREHNLTIPGKILDKTCEIVIQEFEKSHEDVKDGMDIALCAIEDNILQYSGANNPLWIVRNDEIIEIKANKQPIGKHTNLQPFTNHKFNLLKNDSIYLFTDGYLDQFGGEKGKKFKASKLKELILSIQDKSMNEQLKVITNVFNVWRGSLEQVDDVCMIGVRI